MSWRVDSQPVSLVRLIADLIGPDSNSTQVIDEEVYLSEGENLLERDVAPELKEPGLYRIIYRFCYEEDVVTQGSLFFDVGEEVRIELRLDKKLYFRDRYLKFTACCFSSSPLRGRLRFYLDGRVVRCKRVRLDGYREFTFYIRKPRPGSHQAHCTLFRKQKKVQSEKFHFTVERRKRRRCFPIRFCPFWNCK